MAIDDILKEYNKHEMSPGLLKILGIDENIKKIGLSEERVKNVIPVARQYISFWREYPDMFVDYLLTMGNPQNFKFYFYQRVFLRVAARHQYVYAVFPRRICACNIGNNIKEFI